MLEARTKTMIKPYQSDKLTPLYESNATKRARLIEEAATLKSVTISSQALGNVVMLGGGYFTPLPGFISLGDALAIADTMRMRSSGLFWPTPVVNVVPSSEEIDKIEIGDRIALLDPNYDDNRPVAIQTVERIDKADDGELDYIARRVYKTNDRKHPGVAAFFSAGDTFIGGPIVTLSHSYFAEEFPDTFQTAEQIRDQIKKLGWKKVVAFQTRNPMHRAHEELCRMAYESLGCDGILIHMLLGKLKEGDIPAATRDKAIRVLAEKYFPPKSVLITGYGFDMLYAGPREALLHAIFRQNAGCDYLIVGRDHAGVGDYYGPFDAQTIFDEIPSDALEIDIFRADHTAWSKKLNKVVMMRDVPDHTKEDFALLSGTRVREMLSAGESLPEEFSRPEVAQALMEFYRSKDS